MTYQLPQAPRDARGRRQGLVLATIVETEGSTPQVVGASAVFSKAGLVTGTVGGGLLEARVGSVAEDALRRRKSPAHLDPARRRSVGHGGRDLRRHGHRSSSIRASERRRAIFASALDGLRRRRPGALVSRIKPGGGDLVAVERGWLPAGAAALPDDPVMGGLGGPMSSTTPSGAAGRGLMRAGDAMLFVEPVLPLAPARHRRSRTRRPGGRAAGRSSSISASRSSTTGPSSPTRRTSPRRTRSSSATIGEAVARRRGFARTTISSSSPGDIRRTPRPCGPRSAGRRPTSA